MAQSDTLLWISGASYGIGAGLARLNPYPGARIINLDLQPSPRYETVTFDLTRPDTWDAPRKSFEKELAGYKGKRAILLVVGHVGIANGLAAKISAEEYHTALIANGAGPLAMASDFLRLVQPGYEAGVMVMSSGAAHAALVGQSAYGAAKAGIEHWARVMRRELAETGRDAWVVAVRPGLVDTPAARSTAVLDPSIYPRAARMADNLKRFGVSEDEAAARIWKALPPRQGEALISFDDVPPARKG